MAMISAEEKSVRFQIVMPAFNEGQTLEHVLQHARERGYLKHLVVVDDASTDETPHILSSWVQHSGLRAIRMESNCKKEGAIRATMEALQVTGELLPYTLLLDADSMLVGDFTGSDITTQIEHCIENMRQFGQKAIALRIDVTSIGRPSIFMKCAFADYSAMQIDQWLVSLEGHVWVINGVGGIFETDRLLPILQSIEPDFETGDLLITVRLMSGQHRIGFRPTFSVETFVPDTFRSYFNQRRRWERGTTKILWREMSFYAKLFFQMRLLALWTVVHLSIYLGLIVLIGFTLAGKMDWATFSSVLLTSSFLWFVVSMIKGVVIKFYRPKFKFLKYSLCAAINTVLWLLVTTPARLTGFAEAVMQIFLGRGHRKKRIQYSPHYEWLRSSVGSQVIEKSGV